MMVVMIVVAVVAITRAGRNTSHGRYHTVKLRQLISIRLIPSQAKQSKAKQGNAKPTKAKPSQAHALIQTLGRLTLFGVVALSAILTLCMFK